MTSISQTAGANRPTESVSTTVVKTVADAAGVEPTDLPPLYHTLDPEALDNLFSSEFYSSEPEIDAVEFTFAGYEVVVDGTGQVTVTPTDTEDELDG